MAGCTRGAQGRVRNLFLAARRAGGDRQDPFDGGGVGYRLCEIFRSLGIVRLSGIRSFHRIHWPRSEIFPYSGQTSLTIVCKAGMGSLEGP